MSVSFICHCSVLFFGSVNRIGKAVPVAPINMHAQVQKMAAKDFKTLVFLKLAVVTNLNNGNTSRITTHHAGAENGKEGANQTRSNSKNEKGATLNMNEQI